jgi:triacylglycerol lipase
MSNDDQYDQIKLTLEEISTSGAAGAYSTPYAFRLKGSKPNDKAYKELGYTSCKFIDNNGAQVYIVSNKNEIAICLRGTEPKEFSDIKADVKFFWKDGFHGGFLTEYLKVADEIRTEMAKLTKKNPASKITITGHSLGGGMATVAACLLDKVDAVYTYGSPRALTMFKTFKKSVPLIRVVNNNDVVPTVPFKLLMFKHVGELHYMNHWGQVRKLTLWQKIKDKWRGRVRAFKKGQPFDGLYDHSIKEYVKYLEQGNTQ